MIFLSCFIATGVNTAIAEEQSGLFEFGYLTIKDGSNNPLPCTITIYDIDGILKVSDFNASLNIEKITPTSHLSIESEEKHISLDFSINGDSVNPVITIENHGTSNPAGTAPPGSTLTYISVDATNLSYSNFRLTINDLDPGLPIAPGSLKIFWLIRAPEPQWIELPTAIDGNSVSTDIGSTSLFAVTLTGTTPYSQNISIGRISVLDSIGTSLPADIEILDSEDITGAGVTDTAPSISNVANSTPTDSQVYISWDANQTDSDNRVMYSLNTDLSDGSWSDWDYNTNSANILLSGLSPSTTYYYSAYSYNGSNSSFYSNSSIYSFNTIDSEEQSGLFEFGSLAIKDGNNNPLPCTITIYDIDGILKVSDSNASLDIEKITPTSHLSIESEEKHISLDFSINGDSVNPVITIENHGTSNPAGTAPPGSPLTFVSVDATNLSYSNLRLTVNDLDPGLPIAPGSLKIFRLIQITESRWIEQPTGVDGNSVSTDTGSTSIFAVTLTGTTAHSKDISIGKITVLDSIGTTLPADIEILGPVGTIASSTGTLEISRVPSGSHLLINSSQKNIMLDFTLDTDSKDPVIILEDFGDQNPASDILLPADPIRYFMVTAESLGYSDATLTLTNPAIQKGVTLFRLAGTSSNTWEELTTSIDLSGKTITTTLTSDSILALCEKPGIEVKDTNNTPLTVSIQTYDNNRTLKQSIIENELPASQLPEQGFLKIDAMSEKNIAVTFQSPDTSGTDIILDDFGTNNPVNRNPTMPAVKFLEIHASDMEFDSAEIEIGYSDEDIGSLDETKLHILHYSGGNWIVLDSTVDTVNNIVAATTSSLSTFALVYSGASVNTDKSIYQPGETAEIIIVVIDNSGAPVSNAPIVMTVTAPDSSVTGFSTSEGNIVTTPDLGVYHATYLTTVEGQYDIFCTSLIDGEESVFDTYLMVVDSSDFAIVRHAQSKIDPTKYDTFDVTIDITSYTDDDTISIWEYLPADFEVYTDASVVDANNLKVLTWQRSLFDNRTSVNYSYSVPMIWPKLYLLGPLEIDHDDGTFTEARPWYVAVDPTDYILNGDFESGDVNDADYWIESGASWESSGGNPAGNMYMHVTNSIRDEYADQTFTYDGDTPPGIADINFDWYSDVFGFGEAEFYVKLKRPDSDTFDILWNNTVTEDQAWTTVSDLDIAGYFTATGDYTLRLHVNLSSFQGNANAVGRWDNVGLSITGAGVIGTAPSISNVANSTPTDSQVYISWDTNQTDSDNRVMYSLNSDLSDHSWSDWDYNTNSVNILLSGLSPSTTYYYSAYSYNGSNSSFYSNSSIYSFTTIESEEVSYDFGSGAGTDKWAYRWDAGPKPPTDYDVPDVQFASTEYNKTKVNDGDLQIDTADNTYYAAHRFKFDIQESAGDITKIYVHWNGRGYHDQPNSDGATLYIWNYNDNIYEQLDANAVNSEVDLTGEITANFGNYIDTDGNLTILVQQNHYTFNIMSGYRYSHIETDYIAVDITHTEANHPPATGKPDIYDSSLIERYVFTTGESIIIRTDVTDPEGSGDIDAVTIKMTRPDSMVMVNNETMTKFSDISNGFIYEYNYTIPEEITSLGYWDVNVYASDVSGASSAASVLFRVISLNVTVEAGGPYNPDDSVYIEGRVLYADGTPVDQATVELNSTDPFNNMVNQTTVYSNPSGHFSTSYTLSSTATSGLYTVQANVTKGNLQQTESTRYSVEGAIQPSSIRIVTDRGVYLTTPQIWLDNGDTYYSPRQVNITVLVMDEDGMCLSGKDLNVTVTSPTGSVQPVTMNEYEGGFWNGSFTVYHDDPISTYIINATVTNGIFLSDSSTFDVDRFKCDSDNCHNYEPHKNGPRDAHDASAKEAHLAHSPIHWRGGEAAGCGPCHTGQDLECEECHTDLFRGTHSNVPGGALTDKCNYCHTGYNDFTDTGIDKPIPECNTNDCHGGEHEAKPAYLHDGTHADSKVDCGYCHDNMHSIFEPTCDICHRTQHNHSSYNITGVDCHVCHNNLTLDYSSAENLLFNGYTYNASYSTGKNVHSNSLIPDCTDCHGSDEYNTHLGDETEVEAGTAANCTQCHDNFTLEYTGSAFPVGSYNTNGDIHNKSRVAMLPNQTSDLNDSCAICHVTVYDESTRAHSNYTECYKCHYDPDVQYQGVVQDRPMEHTTDEKMIGCRECHFDYDRIVTTIGKPRYWINGTMFGASVHGNQNAIDCRDCHTQYHRPPEYAWKWCECCHSYQSDPINDKDRHNITLKPQNYLLDGTSVLDITDCMTCHNATLYDTSKSTFNRSSGKDCRYCHTYPDQTYY